MSDPIQTYTYYAGKKIGLTKSRESFLVAALAQLLIENGFGRVRPRTPLLTRVTVTDDLLLIAMKVARHIAPTHHAYRFTTTGQRFLISDRLFVTFDVQAGPVQVDDLMARYMLLLVDSCPGRRYLFRLTDRMGINPVILVRILNEEEPLVTAAEQDLHLSLHGSDMLPRGEPPAEAAVFEGVPGTHRPLPGRASLLAAKGGADRLDPM